jgi:hypothetical protein
MQADVIIRYGVFNYRVTQNIHVTLKIIVQLTLAHIQMTYTTIEKKPTPQHNTTNNKTLHVHVIGINTTTKYSHTTVLELLLDT